MWRRYLNNDQAALQLLVESLGRCWMGQEAGAEPEILVWGGQVVMLIYKLRQTSTHTHVYKLIY